MQVGVATTLLGSHVRLKNDKEGETVFVGQSMQGFGLQFMLLLTDGTLQEAHSSEVVGVRLVDGKAALAAQPPQHHGQQSKQEPRGK